jgi:hypothetical protein
VTSFAVRPSKSQGLRRASCCSGPAPVRIDLLAELSQSGTDRVALGGRIGARIERQLGLQKIDVLVADPDTPDSPVLAEARRDGVPL